MTANAGRPGATGFRATWLDAVVLCAIFAAGLGHLHSPFGGDQFLFLIGAQKIAHGGILYRDFWDLKQPVIFYAYALAGELFGFTQVGIHMFETIYQTIFAAILVVVCAQRFAHRWVASIVPLLTIGAYYGFASNYALTSVEALAGLPLFLSAAWTCDAFTAHRKGKLRALAAGVAGAFCVALKLAFFPLLIAFWIVALGFSFRAAGLQRSVAVAIYLAFGFLVPSALLCLYFATSGVLDIALRTALVDPPEILRQLRAADRSPFWPEARAFARMIWPLATLAVVGMTQVRERRDALMLQMVVWLVAGCAIIAVQVWSYDYRFYLIIVPVGVLAAAGFDALWSATQGRGRAPKIAFAGAVCIMLATSTLSVLRVQRNWRGWLHDNALAAAASETFLNRPTARPGAIYVFGDPRVYYFSGRDQAVAINGWSPQLFLPAQWHALRAELAAAKPPYIMVENDYVTRVQRSPEVVALLATSYREASRSREGTWYERR